MSARPPGERAQCWSTAPCSAGARPCAGRNGGPAAVGPRRGPGEQRVDPSATGSPCASCRTRHRSPGACSRQPPQPALTDLEEPRSAGRSTVRDAGAPSCTPVARRRSAPVYPLIGYLRGSFRPPARVWRTQDVDQRPPCPPAHATQNAQIWTDSAVMGIEPTPAQIGGSARHRCAVYPDLVAYDSGIDGSGAFADEAAVHVVDEEPSEEFWTALSASRRSAGAPAGNGRLTARPARRW
jgi:Family of unknown function (DUF5709)